jgi:hypothetical protein
MGEEGSFVSGIVYWDWEIKNYSNQLFASLCGRKTAIAD